MTNKVFNIVLMENNQEDAQFVIDEFKKSKLSHNLEVVKDKESYKQILRQMHPDLVLAESEFPDMKVNEAMYISREISPKSSFILLTVSMDRKSSIKQLMDNPEEFLDKQRLIKLSAAIKASIDILNASEELSRMDEALKGREALLTATLESTADGILVVNNERRIVSYNQNLLRMWRIPRAVMDSGDADKALSFVVNQLLEKDEFLKKVYTLYANSDVESYDMVYLKDNRVFERFSKPQKIEGKTVGRVWSFRDITVRVLAEEALREREADLIRAQKIGRIGSWKYRTDTGITEWSTECYHIFDKDPNTYIPTQEGYFSSIHPEDLERITTLTNESIANLRPFSNIHRIILPGGEVRWIENVTDVIFDKDNNFLGLIGTVRDITEEVTKDDKIKASLKENQMMLREIHHRVKNNLQIVSSLLKLQSVNTHDSQAAEHLRISMNRVKTMAMIHEKLYGSKELSHIEFGGYIKELANHIFTSYGVEPDTVKLIVNARDVYLDINTAVPCGLLINEIVSNSLKHAFPDRSKGIIEIDLNLDEENNYNLCLSDNGIGLPEGINVETSESLGLKLINTLSRQLGSEMRMNVKNGTRYCFIFPPITYLERN